VDDTEKLQFVKKYLALGWALVPLHHMLADGHCSCGRGVPGHVDHNGQSDYDPDHDYKQGGKHPIAGKWQLDVRRDAAIWLEFQQRPNVGIATGAPSGHWVLDYDPANAIEPTAALVVRLMRDGLMPHVETGGGGEHWRFAMPPDFEPTNRRGSLPPGLDVRGTGGQVVAPPSVSGKGAYVELTDAAPYVAPDWLLDMIRPAVPLPRTPPAGWSPPPPGPIMNSDDRGQRYAAGAVRELLAELACAVEGTRNDTAFRVACRMFELINAGWVPPAAVHDYCAAADQANTDGTFNEAEQIAVWRSAQRHVGDRPAELPPEWTDPLRAEVWPDPSAGVLPFSPSSSGAASMSASPVVSFSEPGTISGGSGIQPNGTSRLSTDTPMSPDISATSTLTDPAVAAWEAAVQREVNRELVRDAARERVRTLRAGDVGTSADALDGEWLDIDGVLALPALEPLVDGMLFLDSLARINGPSGHGKSFVAIDLALRAARGMPWAGRAVRQVRVGYVVAEGARGIGTRIRAWEARHGPVDRSTIRLLARPVQMLGVEWTAFVESCRRAALELIIIDTQARATEGIDEVDRAEMSRLVAAAELLRRATGACVLLVHHTPQKGDDGRGHTEVKGALQSELLARKAGRTITLTSRKQKDHEDFEDILFDLVDVPAPPAAMVPGFSEPDDPMVVGVVPVWRGDATAPAADGPREPLGKARARALWTAVHSRYNPGMGGTYAEIRAAWTDDIWTGPTGTGPDGAAWRRAWARAWADLIQRGLLAKAHGASRFKVVELADQSADGVLTPNRDEDDQLISEGPTGFEVILTDITEVEKRM